MRHIKCDCCSATSDLKRSLNVAKQKFIHINTPEELFIYLHVSVILCLVYQDWIRLLKEYSSFTILIW